MACREGCETKDHASYSDCLRSANVQTRVVSDVSNKVTSDLDAYRAARANGIQPQGTSVAKVREAENASRLLGRPYNGDVDPPANMIVNKNTARFANWKE